MTASTSEQLSDQVCGKTIRLSWEDGPTKGSTQEHVFYDNGTVEWHPVSEGKDVSAAATSSASADGAVKTETVKPRYVALKLSPDLCMVSYLSSSGYTLTVILNFTDKSTVAIASNEKSWFPVLGKFEVMS